MIRALLAAIAAMTLAACQAPVLQRGDLAPGCASPAGPVREEGFVRLGGLEQWVSIRGESCANPVILVLHGGPGNPLSPYAHTLYGAWESEFTLVQWDQRGAGRTFGRNPPAAGEALGVERMARDGLELAEHLVRRLGQRRIILLGGSWGSVLGVHMARARPDLFHAYVGVSQLVHGVENMAASRDRVLAVAGAAGDRATVAVLEALGPPPWKDPRSFGALRRAVRAYEARVVTPAPASFWIPSPAYATPQALAESEEGEDYSYLQFVGREGAGMASTIDLPRLGTRFEVPVFLVHGAEDLLTTPELARRYLDRLDAPAKAFVLVPRTGHDPNAALLAAEHEVLTRRVRPLVR